MHAATVDLIRRSLKEIRMARAIVRKSGVKPGGAEGAAGGSTPDVWGSFVYITDTSLGFALTAPAGQSEFAFPVPGQAKMDRRSDMEGATEARLLVTTTSEGLAGARLLVAVSGGAGTRGFIGEPPSAPLDEIGIHVSPWRSFAWDVVEGESNRQGLLWRVSNPNLSTGSISVGLCQLQVR